jgi:hypothetical protein
MLYDNARPMIGRDLTAGIADVIRQVRLYHDGVRYSRLRADGVAPPLPPATEAEAWQRLIDAAPDPDGAREAARAASKARKEGRRT